MKCPHCGQTLGEKICPSCRAEVLTESSFCHRCGVALQGSAAPPPEEEEEGSDFSSRILCSDGTCIGVVDERGICKVCGKAYSGTTD